MKAPAATLTSVIPERESWLHENKAALNAVRRGLKQATEQRFAASPDLATPRSLTIAIQSHRYSSGLEEVSGHSCQTDEEVRRYIEILGGGFGTTLRSVPFDFDFGTLVAPDLDADRS